MHNFGMNVDSHLYSLVVGYYGEKGRKQQASKRQHVKYYLQDAGNLYGVYSEFYGIPNFMVWAVDQTWVDQHKLPLPIDMIIGHTRRYVANMTEEELELFLPVFQQLCSIYNIYRISCSNHGFELHTVLNGRPKRLLITVMNMMDFDSDPDTMGHLYRRETVN